MAQQFFQIVCRLGIFMVCARLLIHFRAKESYEKYLKLLVSVMILIQLFLPLGNFLSAEKKEAGLKELEGIRQEFEAELERAQLQAQEADRMLEQMTLEELQRRVEEEREKAQAGKEEGTIGEGQTGEGTKGTEGEKTGEQAEKEKEEGTIGERQTGEGTEGRKTGEQTEKEEGTTGEGQTGEGTKGTEGGKAGEEKQTKGEQEKWIGEISVEVEKIQPIGGQNTGNG